MNVRTYGDHTFVDVMVEGLPIDTLCRNCKDKTKLIADCNHIRYRYQIYCDGCLDEDSPLGLGNTLIEALKDWEEQNDD